MVCLNVSIVFVLFYISFPDIPGILKQKLNLGLEANSKIIGVAGLAKLSNEEGDSKMQTLNSKRDGNRKTHDSLHYYISEQCCRMRCG